MEIMQEIKADPYMPPLTIPVVKVCPPLPLRTGPPARSNACDYACVTTGSWKRVTSRLTHLSRRVRSVTNRKSATPQPQFQPNASPYTPNRNLGPPFEALNPENPNRRGGGS
eukprot:5440169-Pyramimonas_sp.AAC.1